MSRLTSVMKLQRLLTFVCVAAIIAGTTNSVYALSSGGPGGKWPKTWPKELEPLRKQAWTWEHGFGGMSYDIPFTNREEFEAAWPHILKLKSKGAAITLRRGPHLRVKKDKSAGVLIRMPLKHYSKGPLSLTSITLVVDGDIVDLNRIRLPADTPIIDKRFEDEKKKPVAVKKPAADRRPAATQKPSEKKP